SVNRVPLNHPPFAMLSSPIFNLSAITPRVTRQNLDIVLLEGTMHRVSNLPTWHTPARVTRILPQPLNPSMRIRSNSATNQRGRVTTSGPVEAQHHLPGHLPVRIRQFLPRPEGQP